MKKRVATIFTPAQNLRICSAVLLLACCAVKGTAIEVPLDSHATYLRGDVEDTDAQAAVAINLASLGISAGDIIRIEALGDIDFTIFDSAPETVPLVAGVFSSSATLLGPNELNRVPGAIEAGDDVSTVPTLFGNFQTEIAEDFAISDIVIQVPAGAAYLFVAASDSFYGDNADADNNFGVRITAVPEMASTASLLMLGLSGLFWYSNRRRP
jgi:hypothetical protein